MSDLQLGLIALGAVIVALVLIHNVVQERRASGRAEKAFGERPPDTLFDGAGGRREPTLGALPESTLATKAPPFDQTMPPSGSITAGSEELEALGGPAAEVSSRIDTVAVILADDPIMSEQLQPLLEALQTHPTPTHVEGIVDEQWHPVDTSPRRSWRELRVGLQLASRKGPVPEEEIERFNRAIADFAGAVNAVSQREAPATAAARARELDRLCADTDIEVAVNVVGQYGATFAIARVKAFALEHGLAETASGELVRYASDGQPAFAIRRLDDPSSKPAATYCTGLTFTLDLPQVADAPGVLAEMVKLAETFASALGGQLVDDKRKPLTENGLASIRRSLERILHEMESRGIPAGSSLARRLYS
jgi:hypothetical protein